METSSQGNIDARIYRNVDFHSALLVRDNAVPGMDRGDYRQDLLTDLLSRWRAYDPRRGSVRTFADRIVRHRACDLRLRTLRKEVERTARSLDEPASLEDGSWRALGETVLDDTAPDAIAIGLRADVNRFVGGLPPRLGDCCNILMAGSVSEGARDFGVARSKIYGDIALLRRRADAAGLRIYVSDVPNISGSRPVCGPRSATAHPSTRAMNGGMKNFRLIASAFDTWLESTEAGDKFEYHTGFLAMDVGSDPTGDLQHLARHVREASDRRLVHLLQQRLRAGVYRYLAVARAKEANGEVRRSITEEAA